MEGEGSASRVTAFGSTNDARVGGALAVRVAILRARCCEPGKKNPGANRGQFEGRLPRFPNRLSHNLMESGNHLLT